jgi:hypothetical protein
MLEMLRDLVAHKGNANAALLHAIRQNATAPCDPELWELLHHSLDLHPVVGLRGPGRVVTTILSESTRDASCAAPCVWKLPDLWTQRTRPQVFAKPQTVSHSSHTPHRDLFQISGCHVLRGETSIGASRQNGDWPTGTLPAEQDIGGANLAPRTIRTIPRMRRPRSAHRAEGRSFR